MHRNFSELFKGIDAGKPKTIAVAAAHDAHTLEAVYAAAERFPIRYVLVGDRERITAISSEMGHAPNPDDIVDGGDNADCARKAVGLVREGRGDVLMKGILETGVLLSAVLDRESGIRDADTLSHAAVLEVPAYHKLITVTDGGMVPNPTPEQKASIVRNAVSFCLSLGCVTPKVAALCASETLSGKIQETVDAAGLQSMCAKGELGDCLLEGPISFDIAISREAAAVKGHRSEVSGDADIMLVPNITAGNALIKSAIYWGGGKMAGCIIGAKAPIVLVSRGASAEEKLYSIMLCMKGS